jgi:hypothetical protein
MSESLEPLLEAEPAPTSDERTTALLCHFGGYLTSFILPLLLWLVRKDQSRFLDHHGREALNFQISQIIYFAIVTLLAGIITGVAMAFADWGTALVVGIGAFFLFGLGFLAFETVVVIQAAIAAHRGRLYRYPMNIRLI